MYCLSFWDIRWNETLWSAWMKPGLHHVARFVEDYEEAVAGYAARGMEPYFGGRGLTEKQRFCYFDTETHGGTCSELIETSEFGAFFDFLRAAATDWDGSDPIRRVG